MKISEKGLSLIRRFEGCQLTAYRDSVGVWTIGWGTTNADKTITGRTISRGMRIKQATADRWLEESINHKYAPKVSKYDSKYHWNQNEFDAMVSFAYNVGSIDQLTARGTRSKSTIAKKILEYNKAGGRILAGLTRRRKAEHALFVTPAGKQHYPGRYPVLPPRGYFKLGDGKTQLTDYPTQIKRCESLLKWLGYYKGRTDDGIYGKQCAEAVRKMQDEHKLPVNGCFGDKCLTVAKKIMK